MLPSPTWSSYRRKSPRFPTTSDVTLRRALSASIIAGSLRDLSTGGCLIVLADPPGLNIAEVIELKLRSHVFNFRVLGFVRHIAFDGITAGVQFHAISAEDSHNLVGFISSLQAPPALDGPGTFWQL